MDILDQIIAANDIKIEPYPVSEWGVTIHLRTIDGIGRAAMAVAGWTDESAVIYGTCREDGSPLFTSDHLDLLKKKNGLVITKIAEAVMRHSGWKGDDEIKKP